MPALWFVEAAQTGLSARVREALAPATGASAASKARIANYLAAGLQLLVQHVNGPGMKCELVESCRRLAERDLRYHFVYRLPNSTGFGWAIGAALAKALDPQRTDPRQDTRASALCGLLQGYMTLLDGLNDEVVGVAGLDFEDMRVRLSAQLADGGRAVYSGNAHPIVQLTEHFADRWLELARRSFAPSASLNAAWRDAILAAWDAERLSTCARLDIEPHPDSKWLAALRDRTRLPHWTQGLAVLMIHGLPAGTSFEAYRDLLKAIADLASYLDDVCDLGKDLTAQRWNTITADLYLRRPFPLHDVRETTLRLCYALAFDANLDQIVAAGLGLVAELERSVEASGLNPSCIAPLTCDLLVSYFGEGS